MNHLTMFTPAMQVDSQLLTQALKDNQIVLSASQFQQCLDYLNLLTKWNRHLNLTAIIDGREMIYKHLIDSLSIRYAILGDHSLDVGSGAGLPGIPLAIALPDKQFTLLDCLEKRSYFLAQAKRSLNLKNVRVIHSRIEDHHEAHYAQIMSRAFTQIPNFLALCKPIAQADTRILAMLGKRQAFAQLDPDFTLIAQDPLKIIGLDAERHLFIFQKSLKYGQSSREKDTS